MKVTLKITCSHCSIFCIISQMPAMILTPKRVWQNSSVVMACVSINDGKTTVIKIVSMDPTKTKSAEKWCSCSRKKVIKPASYYIINRAALSVACKLFVNC